MNANTILDYFPRGYRWATDVECDRAQHPAYFSRMVQVQVYPGADQTDLAIKV